MVHRERNGDILIDALIAGNITYHPHITRMQIIWLDNSTVLASRRWPIALSHLRRCDWGTSQLRGERARFGYVHLNLEQRCSTRAGACSLDRGCFNTWAKGTNEYRNR